MNDILVDQTSLQNAIILSRLLAQALTYPDPDFVNRLQTQAGNLNIAIMADKEISIGDFLEELNALTKLPLDQVQGEHTRLLINAYPKVPCPPYESVYREGALLGEAAEDVYQVFLKWGVAAEEAEVDHVGAELEFLAYLMTLGTPESLTDADQFMKNHMMTWLPRFGTDLARESRLGFYREIGNLIIKILPMNDRNSLVEE